VIEAHLIEAHLIEAHLIEAHMVDIDLIGASPVDAGSIGTRPVDAGSIGTRPIGAHPIQAGLIGAGLIRAGLIRAALIDDRPIGAGHRAPAFARRTRSMPVVTSEASDGQAAFAAVGSARTTVVLPGGSASTVGCTACRNRRITRCRATLEPTERPTTNPTSAGAVAPGGPGW
jgi:hypothetical protein